MKKLLAAIPIPFAGVMLAFTSLGMLLGGYAGWAHAAFGCIAAIIWVFLVGKAMVCRAGVRQTLRQDAIVAGVSGTFCMATILLSSYLIAVIGLAAARVIWLCAIAFYLAFIVWFTVRHASRRDISTMLTNYFVVYVGIVTASLTAPAFHMIALGRFMLWFALVCWIICLIPVTRRYVRDAPRKDPQRPLICIYIAPPSIILAGYLVCYGQTLTWFATLMFVVSLAVYIFVAVRLPRLLRLPFFPSYSAMTFPFVIAATATLRYGSALTQAGLGAAANATMVLGFLQTAIALALVIYVFCRYLVFIVKASRTA